MRQHISWDIKRLGRNPENYHPKSLTARAALILKFEVAPDKTQRGQRGRRKVSSQSIAETAFRCEVSAAIKESTEELVGNVHEMWRRQMRDDGVRICS